MKISEFSYQLPKDRIAQHPPAVRGSSRLLVLDRLSGSIADKRYQDLVDYFEAGDVLVLNDTKVIKARIIALDHAGKQIELVLLEKHGHSQDKHAHKALYRGRLSLGEKLSVGSVVLTVDGLEDGGIAVLKSDSNLEHLVATRGEVPLPPYMKRAATKEDEARYQTVFADRDGSVAAPTASLNMTEKLLGQLAAKGVVVRYLTLHVGLGTFLPIRSDEVEGHKMHSEYFEIPAETLSSLRAAKQSGSRVFALGTTVARSLEFASSSILSTEERHSISGEADIFIYPGYKFGLVDGLITNFHVPKSTVLMLAAAFGSWDNLKLAYDHALKSDYKFLSYGDSMLIL